MSSVGSALSSTPCFIAGSSNLREGSFLAWTAARRHQATQHSRRSQTSVALNAIFLDDAAHINAPIPSMPSYISPFSSSATTYLADLNPLQRDVAHWLSTTAYSTADINLNNNNLLNSEPTNILSTTSTFIASSSPDRPPTKDEINQLQQGLAAFYGTERNVPVAYDLLSKCINAWEKTNQGGDEIAGLYRVRGDVNMVCMRKLIEARYI